IPTRSQIRYASCISVVSGEQLEIVTKEFGDKNEIKEVLDGDPHSDTKKLSGWRTRMVVKSEPPVTLKTIMYCLCLRYITISVLKKRK
ncbi:hypothetical protein IGI04_036462, partial [Brassica rapa subsp. trilocularis]